MSKLTKIALALCLSAIVCTAVHAGADSFSTNVTVSGYSAEISGTADRAEGTEVSVIVVRPGGDIFSVVRDADANEKNLLNNNAACIIQTSVNDKKEFEYTCKLDMSERSGTYKLRVQVYGESDVREKDFTFVNESRAQTAQMLIDSAGAGEFKSILDEYAPDIDIAAGENYLLFTDKEKEYTADAAAKAQGDKKAEFIGAANRIVSIRDMKALDKAELKALVEKGEVTGADESQISEYSGLTTLKKDLFIADLYSGIRDKETPDEIHTAFSEAMTEVKNTASQPSSGGGSSGGGSSGGGSYGGSSGGRSSGGASSGGGSVSVTGNYNADPDKPYILDVPQNDGFTDMGNTMWADTAVRMLAERGIIKGRSKELFCPEEAVTREEFLKMVIESLNIIGISEENKTFSDVDADAWYSHYVDTGVGCGVIKGISDTEFGVGLPVTREDMATILYRAVRYGEVNLYSVTEIEFTDRNDISEYALEAVKVLSSAKVINGMEDGSFMPKQTATRAEAAVMLYNLLYR